MLPKPARCAWRFSAYRDPGRVDLPQLRTPRCDRPPRRVRRARRAARGEVRVRAIARSWKACAGESAGSRRTSPPALSRAFHHRPESRRGSEVYRGSKPNRTHRRRVGSGNCVSCATSASDMAISVSVPTERAPARDARVNPTGWEPEPRWGRLSPALDEPQKGCAQGRPPDHPSSWNPAACTFRPFWTSSTASQEQRGCRARQC